MLLLPFLLVNTASALDCVFVDIEDRLVGFDLIASGKVISTSYFTRTSTFEIYEVWTPENFDKRSVKVTTPGGDWGFRLEKGEEYLIYANSKGEDFSLGWCSSHRLLSSAGEDVAKLNKLRDPLSNCLSLDCENPVVVPEQNIFQRILGWFGRLFG